MLGHIDSSTYETIRLLPARRMQGRLFRAAEVLFCLQNGIDLSF
jgi:hypothetical protein